MCAETPLSEGKGEKEYSREIKDTYTVAGEYISRFEVKSRRRCFFEESGRETEKERERCLSLNLSMNLSAAAAAAVSRR